MLNKNSSREEKSVAADAVFWQLADAILDKINYVSNPFSNNGESYTGTTSYRGWSRITDTSKGKYFNASKSSRMKCLFYLYNPTQLHGYILSPVVYNNSASLNTISSMSDIDAYVGIRIDAGNISVCVKDYGKNEKLFPTSYSFSGPAPTETLVLDIGYTGRTADVLIDDVSVWSGPVDLGYSQIISETFLPLLSPVKSLDGSAVDINIENFQFIQNNQ